MQVFKVDLKCQLYIFNVCNRSAKFQKSSLKIVEVDYTIHIIYTSSVYDTFL